MADHAVRGKKTKKVTIAAAFAALAVVAAMGTSALADETGQKGEATCDLTVTDGNTVVDDTEFIRDLDSGDDGEQTVTLADSRQVGQHNAPVAFDLECDIARSASASSSRYSLIIFAETSSGSEVLNDVDQETVSGSRQTISLHREVTLAQALGNFIRTYGAAVKSL